MEFHRKKIKPQSKVMLLSSDKKFSKDFELWPLNFTKLSIYLYYAIFIPTIYNYILVNQNSSILILTFSAALLMNCFAFRSQIAGTVMTQYTSSQVKSSKFLVFNLFCKLSLKNWITAAKTSTAGSSLSVMSFNFVDSDRSLLENKQ